MAFESLKKYLFNLGKYLIKISKKCVLKAIWTILHHNKEEKWKTKFSKFGPAGIETMHVSDKGLSCLKG